MPTLTITAKGQVTLRKDILRHLGVKPGDKIVVEWLPDGAIAVRARSTGRISEIFNLLKADRRKSLSISEMNRIVADRWAGRR